MTKNNKLVLLRIEKQEAKLHNEPIEQAWVARKGVLDFHFCIYGLDGAYSGGFYHGVLQLSEEYPFAPPKLLFFTPSGRFEVNKPICTSFTNYHRQSWTSSWNVRTMILAIISFMNTEEQGAGYVNDSSFTRRQFARSSMEFNKKDPLFCQLFKKQIAQYKKKKASEQSNPSTGTSNSQTNPSEIGREAINQNTKVNFLYIVLGLIVFFWIMFRKD